MTEVEVINLVGLPPGDYMTPGARKMLPRQMREKGVIQNMLYMGLDDKIAAQGVTYREWLSDDGGLFVVFGKNGEVACSYYERYPGLHTIRQSIRVE